VIQYIGDLTFVDGILTPPASWNRVDFAEPEPQEIALSFGECCECGATIGRGDPMLCDECINALPEGF
jgi:hypothetical protein